MPETLGTLNLKIARLEQHLKVLEQQKELSRGYPAYQVNLAQEQLQICEELQQLLTERHQLLDPFLEPAK